MEFYAIYTCTCPLRQLRDHVKSAKSTNDLEKAKGEIASLQSILNEEREKNRLQNENQEMENERLRLELREQRRNNQPVAKKEVKRVDVRNVELEKLRQELGAKR